MAGPRQSQCIAGALSKPAPGIMTGMLPLDKTGVKLQSIVKKGKAAYMQRVQENGGDKSEAGLAPQAATFVCALHKLLLSGQTSLINRAKERERDRKS